eukprot:2271632-Alexandrium_andersonii.AAC.1
MIPWGCSIHRLRFWTLRPEVVALCHSWLRLTTTSCGCPHLFCDSAVRDAIASCDSGKFG